VKLAPIELSIFWSARLDRDPAITWFRQVLREAAREGVRGAGLGAVAPESEATSRR